jgi:hypothetical protein
MATREYLKSNMYISGNMADSVALETSTVKVKKELKYYYLHREEILAKKREKREADPKYQEKLQEKEEKKKRAEEEKVERAKERARKRAEALGLTLPVRKENA